jgi:hypothetical protein
VAPGLGEGIPLPALWPCVPGLLCKQQTSNGPRHAPAFLPGPRPPHLLTSTRAYITLSHGDSRGGCLCTLKLRGKEVWAVTVTLTHHRGCPGCSEGQDPISTFTPEMFKRTSFTSQGIGDKDQEDLSGDFRPRCQYP